MAEQGNRRGRKHEEKDPKDTDGMRVWQRRSQHHHVVVLFAIMLILPFLVMEMHMGLWGSPSRSLALEQDERMQIPFHVMERSGMSSERIPTTQSTDYWSQFDNPEDILRKRDNSTVSNRIHLLPTTLFNTNHRSDTSSAIFVFGRGYNASDWMRFVGSLIETGYKGDIVLGIADDMMLKNSEDSKLLQNFLEYTSHYHNVIVYHIDLDCLPKQMRTEHGIVNSTTQLGMKCRSRDWQDENGKTILDPRIHRHVSQIRYEYYWKWAWHYNQNTNILVSDVRDVYFQGDPFNTLHQPPTTLQVFVEDDRTQLKEELNNKIWIKKSRGNEVLKLIGDNPIVCSGITMGGQVAMQTYFAAMIQSFDETQCTMAGCDQGHHNYLLRSGRLDLWKQNDGSVPAIQQINYVERGNGVVNTLGLYCKLEQEASDSQNVTLPVFNADGTTISPVLHQFDRCQALKEEIEAKTGQLVKDWKAKLGSTIRVS